MKINTRSATGRFIRAMEKFRVDDFKPMLGVGRDYELDSIDVGFNLRPINDTETVLQSLVIVYPASGQGTKAMEIICKIADRCDVILILDALPYETRYATPMSRTTLMRWYTRFGFVPEGHGSIMRRIPK
jgi:hypothetical protein